MWVHFLNKVWDILQWEGKGEGGKAKKCSVRKKESKTTQTAMKINKFSERKKK